MKKIFFCLLIIISLLLISCKNTSMTTNTQAFGTEVSEDERRYIVDDEVGLFITEVHSIKNLVKYEIYRNGDIMNIDFYFDENATRSDIMSSKDVATEVFVVQRVFKMGGPYPEVLYGEDIWNQVNHRVFLEDEKILEQNIYKNIVTINDINYYEDTNKILSTRIEENDITKELAQSIKKKNLFNIKDIVFEKSFHGSVLLIKIDTRKELNNEKISEIENCISGDFASELANKSINTHNMNIDYRGIVLLLYSNDKLYHENTYHNGEDNNYWFSEYWGDHNFYDFNN